MPELQSRLEVALADRYRIERQLGQGGMATVYLADDLKHDRKVAIKVLRPELGAVLGAERFLAEIRITARLDHPHILTLIDLRPLLLRLQLGQVLVHYRDPHAPLSHSRRDALDGGVADVADGEDPRNAGLQQVRIALQPSCTTRRDSARPGIPTPFKRC